MTCKIFVTLALWASFVVAFPHAIMDELVKSGALAKLHESHAATPPQGGAPLPLAPPPFDAAAQFISTTGQYKFVAPGSNDARGMCPGLNAMANHGYLPHNGVATIPQFVEATQRVFGMGPDLALFLAVFGAVVDGQLTYWSIDGTPHFGIGGSHNNYESDSSPLKSDLYQYGSNKMLVMSQFYELYNMQPDASTANYNLDVLLKFRQIRFTESIQKNPVFYYGPFSGQIVTQAAFTFIYRFMANKSAENPEGILNKDVLKSFMAIQGPENNLTWVPGNERIPDNWYKRNPIDAYTIPYFATDVFYYGIHNPLFVLPGCNNGKVNTYDTIDPSVLSNGAYSLQQALKNPLCFSLGLLQAQLPGITGLTTTLLAPLTSLITNVTTTLNCAARIGSVNSSALGICPGFSLYGGPTANVVAGAIQS